MTNRQEETPQPQGWERRLKDNWDDAFLPDVPQTIKSFEVLNRDGTYSCISCGIKRVAIADWWIEEITTLLAQKDREKAEMMREIVGAVKGTLELCNDDSFERVCNCHKGLADTLKAITTIAEKHNIKL